MAMPPGFGDRMNANDPASELDSSSISSAPASPQHDTIRVARPNSDVLGGGVVNAASATSAMSNAATSGLHANTTAPKSAAAPEKVKRQRKKKEVGPDGKPIDDGKPKKPRKPRAPKETTTANGTAATGASRKKVKTEDKPAPDAPAQSRQPTITEMVGSFQTPTSAPHNPSHPRPAPAFANEPPRASLMPQASNPPTPRPVSSGQHYDPIRSATYESSSHRPVQPPAGILSAQASPHVNRASASPSIASLIDPPLITKTSAPTMTHSPQTSMPHPHHQSNTQPPTPTQQPINAFAAPSLSSQTSPLPSSARETAIPIVDGAMDIEVVAQASRPQLSTQQEKMPEVKPAPSKSSSSEPTPKAAKPTPPTAPKGTGSGLLSSSNLFGGPSSNDPSERRGVNIDIQIKLNPAGGNTINIAQEIIKKYGRDAINPRAAAHRERLLQVAAAANKIDGGSADDMSVDLSEYDNDSNVEMGGMDDTTSVQPDGEKPRKRRKKVEEYDKEDDFIDDTELAWQEQAAVAKDGFFVYSGPLVQPGQSAQVESSSAPARGGRGRGRGRGRGASAGGTTHASLAKEKEPKDPNAPNTGRGRGRGRGTGAPRKPRITKADRERMEIEKRDRERGAAGPGPSAATTLPSNATPLNLVSSQQTYTMPGMGATS